MAIYMYNSRTINQDYLDRYNILFQLFLNLKVTRRQITELVVIRFLRSDHQATTHKP